MSKTFVQAIIPLIFGLITAVSPLFTQSIGPCDPSDCLFLQPQNEPLDSQLLVYASNQWSIDEWDNSLGCAFFNQCENLRMQVFAPELPPGEKRPLVVFIHGGGFVSGSYQDFVPAARAFAQLGYVTASIEYRLCKRNNCQLMANLGCPVLCNGNYIADLGTGAYVAAVDANKAIHYLQEHAESFHINPDNIIVCGHSAGAWTAMNVAFLEQTEADAVSAGFKNGWGPLNPVQGIKGVVCLSGAVTDTAMIDAYENIPVFVLHGNCDPTVCYGYDAVFHCNSAYPKVFGGRFIAERQQQLGHGYYLFSGIGMGHDIRPLQDAWLPEATRYIRNAMLCGAFIQKHTATEQIPGSAECNLLESDIVGCDLQFNHSRLALSTLPLSSVWGGPAAPCGGGLVGTRVVERPAQATLSPTLARDRVWLSLPEGSSEASAALFDGPGRRLRNWNVQGAGKYELTLSGLPSGMYFFRLNLPGKPVQTIKIIKME